MFKLFFKSKGGTPTKDIVPEYYNVINHIDVNNMQELQEAVTPIINSSGFPAERFDLGYDKVSYLNTVNVDTKLSNYHYNATRK